MERSFWQQTSAAKGFPKLSVDIEADVAVVGGGMVGLTAALELAKAGKKVCLLESDTIGGGTSGKSTGKVTLQCGAIYGKLIRKRSITDAKSYLKLGQKGLDYIRNQGRNHMGITQEESAWLMSFSDTEAKMIEDEYRASVKLGLPVKITSTVPIGLKVKNALELPNQLQINPYRYLCLLLQQAEEAGVRIFEDSRAIDFKKSDRIDVITADGYKLSAPQVILASHYPIYRRGGKMIPRLTPARTYLIAGECKEYPGGMYITVGNAVRSIRAYPQEGRTMLLVGGAGHRTGKFREDSYSKLEEFGKRHFAVEEFPYRWSAQDYNTYDDLPFVGKMIGEDDIYIATGFAKWGMAAGTGAALYLSSLILEGVCDSQRTLTPKRYTDFFTGDFVTGSWTMGKELVVTRTYKTNNKPPKEPGTAAVMSIGGTRCGVYRREDHTLAAVELTCTHIGCGMYFNPLEKTWDCPCHGSRFDVDGNVIEGPALSSLHKVKLIIE